MNAPLPRQPDRLSGERPSNEWTSGPNEASNCRRTSKPQILNRKPRAFMFVLRICNEILADSFDSLLLLLWLSFLAIGLGKQGARPLPHTPFIRHRSKEETMGVLNNSKRSAMGELFLNPFPPPSCHRLAPTADNMEWGSRWFWWLWVAFGGMAVQVTQTFIHLLNRCSAILPCHCTRDCLSVCLPVCLSICLFGLVTGWLTNRQPLYCAVHRRGHHLLNCHWCLSQRSLNIKCKDLNLPLLLLCLLIWSRFGHSTASSKQFHYILLQSLVLFFTTTTAISGYVSHCVMIISTRTCQYQSNSKFCTRTSCAWINIHDWWWALKETSLCAAASASAVARAWMMTGVHKGRDIAENMGSIIVIPIPHYDATLHYLQSSIPYSTQPNPATTR